MKAKAQSKPENSVPDSQNNDEAPQSNEGAPDKPQKFMVRAVFGLMVHPFEGGKTFNTDKITPVDKIDSWTESQIEAGKLEIV